MANPPESTTAPFSMSTNAAATYLGFSPETLKTWRAKGLGPLYSKLGTGRRAKVVYRVSDLEAFVNAGLVGNPAA